MVSILICACGIMLTMIVQGFIEDEAMSLETRNVLCVPLKLRKGDVVGVVQLINKTSGGVMALGGSSGTLLRAASDDLAGMGRPFTVEDSSFLQVFASHAATAVADDISHELCQPPEQPAKQLEEELALISDDHDPAGLHHWVRYLMFATACSV